MAVYEIIEPTSSSELFEITCVSGPEGPHEVRLLEGIRTVLGDIETGTVAASGPALRRLRGIASEGLVIQWHRADIWLEELNLFKMEFYIVTSEARYTGKYFSAYYKAGDGYYDMEYYILQDKVPPNEYNAFISRYSSIRASLIAIIESEISTERRKALSAWRKLLNRAQRRRGDTGGWFDDWISSRLQAYGERHDGIIKRLTSYLLRLVMYGLNALGRDELDAANDHVADLEAEIVKREASRIKNSYVTKLGVVSFLCAGLFSAVYVVVRFGLGNHPDWVLFRFREFLIIAAGCSVGTWLSFAIRHPRLEAVLDIAVLEADQLSPWNRVLFAVSLAIVIGLVLQSGMLTITVNQFTSTFQFNGVRALLLGLFCGISEIALRSIVGGRSDDFMKRLAAEKASNS